MTRKSITLRDELWEEWINSILDLPKNRPNPEVLTMLANRINGLEISVAVSLCERYPQRFRDKLKDADVNALDIFFATLREDRRGLFLDLSKAQEVTEHKFAKRSVELENLIISTLLIPEKTDPNPSITLANRLNMCTLKSVAWLCENHKDAFRHRILKGFYFLNVIDDFFDRLREDRRSLLLSLVPELPAKKQKAILFKEFNLQLQKLETKTDELRAKACMVDPNYNPRYENVAPVARELMFELREALGNYIPTSSQTTLEEFKTQCQTAIDKAAIEFKKHRGVWHQLHPILKAIIGLFATVTIVPALAVAVFSKDGYVNTFFRTPPTDSEVKLNEFEHEVSSLISSCAGA